MRGVKKSLKRRLHKKRITTGTEVYFKVLILVSMHGNLMHTGMERLTSSFLRKEGEKQAPTKIRISTTKIHILCVILSLS